ncbi:MULTISPECIES: septum formation initiator family protein [unclassified Halanaerobium]|uniref:FtsB family cell division protein n=1 Tax=unclassified Halanaerobium TaxID=2641197 RepID=UPI000DF253F0|nr:MULTISPECIES: septum formation initiator family protein [unclassified Halanaerobium]RCW51375.1 septum formation initiator [Halanaerobium sp. MA284_MarDTE_T2]RCW81426.1 septum formation initiator [Halanaerobium sp. DL-01]
MYNSAENFYNSNSGSKSSSGNKLYASSDLRKKIFAGIYIFTLFLVGTMFIIYIGQILKINQYNYQILELEDKLSQLEENNEELQIKLASETSLDKIEKTARNRLHMVEAEKRTIVFYNNRQIEKTQFVANIPEERFFIARIYDKIVERLVKVQAKSPE